MDFFKKKKNKSNNTIQEEKRPGYNEPLPNHWAFDDDPLLNIEPVFASSKNENNNMQQPIQQQPIQGQPIQGQPIQGQFTQQPMYQPPRQQSYRNNPNNPLNNIINNAIEKSSNLKQEVIQNDPVIAKLNRIEQVKKYGGVDESLYTDLSKSNNVRSYAKNAENFTRENSDSKINSRINESAIERARRLERRAKRIREGQNVNLTDEQLAINNTMIQRRIKNNQNAFAINIDKRSLYIQNSNLERVKAIETERRAKEKMSMLNPMVSNQPIPEEEFNPFKNKSSSIDEPINKQTEPNNNISQKFDNEVMFLEKELFKALKKWQEHQVNKLNKMISKKVNQINSIEFSNEEEKIKYLKYKIRQLYSSINKGKMHKDGKK